MKTTMKSLMILSAAALMLGFATTNSAEAGHKKNWRVSAGWSGGGGGFGFSYGRGRYANPYRPIFRPAMCAPIIVAPPIHTHCFAVTTQRIWVEPVFQQQIASYDCYGRPIFQSVCVRQGYWRNARYNTCGCGHSVVLGY